RPLREVKKFGSSWATAPELSASISPPRYICLATAMGIHRKTKWRAALPGTGVHEMETGVQEPARGQTTETYLSETNRQQTAEEFMAAIIQGMETLKNGDFSVRLPVAWTGLPGKFADQFNEIATANERMASELKRVVQAVGKEGKVSERIQLERRRGAWGEMEGSVNTLVQDLLRPTTEVTRAIAAVAQGNLTQTVRMDVDGRPLEGEFLRSARIVNTMIQQLGVFTEEVTRVAR